MMAPDFSGLAVFAIIGLLVTVLFIIAAIVAFVLWLFGYWHIGITFSF